MLNPFLWRNIAFFHSHFYWIRTNLLSCFLVNKIITLRFTKLHCHHSPRTWKCTITHCHHVHGNVHLRVYIIFFSYYVEAEKANNNDNNDNNNELIFVNVHSTLSLSLLSSAKFPTHFSTMKYWIQKLKMLSIFQMKIHEITRNIVWRTTILAQYHRIALCRVTDLLDFFLKG